MYTCSVRSSVAALDPYTPGLSIDEIRQKYGLETVIKMASNENPLGVPPLAKAALAAHAAEAFRYPRSGTPRLVKALAELHAVSPSRIVVGNGSDEVIDLFIRILARPEHDTIVCQSPCFSLYPIQAQIAGVSCVRVPLKEDFSFDFAGLLSCVDARTKLVFLTTPDNPSGYCPPRSEVRAFAEALGQAAPQALLVLDEAYMDFHPTEEAASLFYDRPLPDNVAIMRTFSKSYGLAGLRIGYAYVPEELAQAFFKARLPFSVSVLAEEAALAALKDHLFRELTLETVRTQRARLTEELRAMGAQVQDSTANFLLFTLPQAAKSARECFEALLSRGIIIRRLTGYGLPDHLRVSIGNVEENTAFLRELRRFLGETPTADEAHPA